MESASTVFEAALVEHVGPGTHIPGVIAPGLTEALMAEEPSSIDLVVRRLDDGTEIIRTPADLGDPDTLLATARQDLARMTVDEFVAEWKMPII
jgi:hypothetical protein